MKKLVVFDLDNTLTESKTPLDVLSSALVKQLLSKTNVAVISGASFEQIQKQFIWPLSADISTLPHLYILPTSGAELCIYEGEWKKKYSEKLSVDEKKLIRTMFTDALGLTKEELGSRLEDRNSGMTYSALGINAPLDAKKIWDIDQKKRKEIVAKLQPYLKGLEARIGGTTSIDISKRGIDKAYGVQNLINHLKISSKDVVFVGDALFPGGNDSAVLRLGIEAKVTTGPEQTRSIIKAILSGN